MSFSPFSLRRSIERFRQRIETLQFLWFQKPYPNQLFGSTTYSQFGEDIIVANLFARLGIDAPTYIDIGAHHPFDCSNTALLHARGSRGINVEPNRILLTEFERYRPNDINLCVGVGPENGELDFLSMGDTFGRNTFLPEVARACQEQNPGVHVNSISRIPILTLEKIINDYSKGIFPQFLSIDAEGMDIPILQSADFSHNAPLVVCVETYCGLADDAQEIVRIMRGKGFDPVFRTVGNLLFAHNSVSGSLMAPG